MSGHSKWHNIQAKKGKADAARGKIFTKIGREIAIAVREGGSNPDVNGKLRDVIAKAKANNMPNDNITRSIKKAAGELGNVDYEQITYEGYAPGGVAVIVETITDNRNRTASDIRHCFSKVGGNMGTTGSVSFMFDQKGVLVVERQPGMDEDEMMMMALDAGAEDVNDGRGCLRNLHRAQRPDHRARQPWKSRACTSFLTAERTDDSPRTPWPWRVRTWRPFRRCMELPGRLRRRRRKCSTTPSCPRRKRRSKRSFLSFCDKVQNPPPRMQGRRVFYGEIYVFINHLEKQISGFARGFFFWSEAPPARGAGGIPTSPLCPPGPPIPPSNGRGIPPDPPCTAAGTSPCFSTDRVRIGHALCLPWGPQPIGDRIGYAFRPAPEPRHVPQQSFPTVTVSCHDSKDNPAP